jgi:hypothetical protein
MALEKARLMFKEVAAEEEGSAGAEGSDKLLRAGLLRVEKEPSPSKQPTIKQEPTEEARSSPWIKNPSPPTPAPEFTPPLDLNFSNELAEERRQKASKEWNQAQREKGEQFVFTPKREGSAGPFSGLSDRKTSPAPSSSVRNPGSQRRATSGRQSGLFCQTPVSNTTDGNTPSTLTGRQRVIFAKPEASKTTAGGAASVKGLSDDDLLQKTQRVGDHGLQRVQINGRGPYIEGCPPPEGQKLGRVVVFLIHGPGMETSCEQRDGKL